MKPFDKIALVRKVQGLTVVQKSLLNAIASHVGNNEFAFLSITTLQEDCCIAKRNSVINGISALTKLGILTKKQPNSQCKSNQFSINFKQIASNLGLSVTEGNQQVLVTQSYSASNPGLLAPVDNSDSLVTQGYHPSNPQLLPLVTQGYPKEHINNNEITRENKALSPFDKFEPTFEQREFCKSHNIVCAIEKIKYTSYMKSKGIVLKDIYAGFDKWLWDEIKHAQSKPSPQKANGGNLTNFFGHTENTTYKGMRDFTQERLDREEAERIKNEIH